MHGGQTHSTPPPEEDTLSCSSDDSFVTADTHPGSDSINSLSAVHLASSLNFIGSPVRAAASQSTGSVGSRQPSTAVRHPAPWLAPAPSRIRFGPLHPTSEPSTFSQTVTLARRVVAIREMLDRGIAERPALRQLLDTASLSYPEAGRSAAVNPFSAPHGPVIATANPFASFAPRGPVTATSNPFAPRGPVTATYNPFAPRSGPVTATSPGNNSFGRPSPPPIFNPFAPVRPNGVMPNGVVANEVVTDSYHPGGFAPRPQDFNPEYRPPDSDTDGWDWEGLPTPGAENEYRSEASSEEDEERIPVGGPVRGLLAAVDPEALEASLAEILAEAEGDDIDYEADDSSGLGEDGDLDEV
jgi:hypothetical protein